MDVVAKIQALRALRSRVASASLKPSLRVMLRLASRWLQASMESDMDMLMRIQVLEGAAGVPVGSWMKLQRKGMQLAQQHFEGKPVDPSWFALGTNTGMYALVYRAVQKGIDVAKYRHVDPLDMINSGLMGIGANIDGDEIKRPCYAAGLKASSGIQSGSETPTKVAAGFLGRIFYNKVFALKGQQKELQLPTNEEGEVMNIADPSYDPNALPGESYDAESFGEFLAEMVFHNLHDPLGMKVRDLMRATWIDDASMIAWLDIIEQERRFPTKKEVSERTGINPAVFQARHWVPRWKVFLKALRTKTVILNALQERARDEGITWDPDSVQDADPSSLLTPRSDRARPRAASLREVLVGRIASRFILGQNW